LNEREAKKDTLVSIDKTNPLVKYLSMLLYCNNWVIIINPGEQIRTKNYFIAIASFRMRLDYILSTILRMAPTYV